LDGFLQLQVKIVALTDRRIKRFRRDIFAFHKPGYRILVNQQRLLVIEKENLIWHRCDPIL